jgi:hypothetical protein
VGFEPTNLSSLHVPTGSPGLALFEDFLTAWTVTLKRATFQQY